MRPTLWMAASLAVGIAAADWLRPHPALVGAALLLCLVAAARVRGVAVLLLAIALFGALRFAYVQTAGRGSLEAWEGERITLVGTVVQEPDVKAGGLVAFTVSAEGLQGGEAVSGRVYVLQRGGTVPGYGERVALTGRLERPIGPRTPGGYDQAAYLARQSVYLTVQTGAVERLGPGRLDPVRRAAVAVRIRLEGVLRSALPPREAGLLAGLLFGSRSELDEEIREAFKAAGVFHLLAVSGGNVAMLVIPLLALFRRAGAGPRMASALAIPVVIFFVFLTGATPSVLRAGLMAVLVLLGDVLRRERNALNTLGVATLLLLIASPALLFDLGFQLSAGATLGILLLARRIEGWLSPRLMPLFGERLGTWLAAGLSVTFAAQAMVEPLSLHHFGLFSVIAPLANLMVLLFVEWLVPLGLVVSIAGAFWPPVAWLLPVAAEPGLILLIYGVRAVASLPGACLEVGKLPSTWVVVWYAGLAVLTVPPLRLGLNRRTLRLRRSLQEARLGVRLSALAGLCGIVVTAATWRFALAAPPDELRITFLDVGQGDAALIQAPGGLTMLIDAGNAYPPDPSRDRMGYDSGVQVILPYLRQSGLRRLDYLVLSHPDTDHTGGAPAVLQGVEIGAILVSAAEADERGQSRTLTLARERGIPVYQPIQGDRLQLGDHVIAEVLGPPRERFSGTRSDENANCLALRLVYREVAVLFACDLEAAAEERLAADGHNLGAQVLKVSHHGSAQSTTPEFLRQVGPRYAVISAGNGNPFGHPHPAVLGRMQQNGAEVWRTDRHGTVTLRTDGFSLRIEASRGRPGDEGYRPLALLGRRLFRAW